MKFVMICVTSLLLAVSTGIAARGYGHGYGHGYGNGYRHHGYGHHGSHAGYLFGGLLLGSILAQPRYAPPPRVVYVPQPTATTMVPARHVPTQATISRRLLRDINGNCFERKIDQAGTELRIQLPATECAW